MKVLLSQDVIQARIAEMGRQITQEYAGREPHLVGVLKGAFPFDGPLALDRAAADAGFHRGVLVRYLKGDKPGPGQMRKLAQIIRSKQPGPGDFRFIDLFAGIGGMRLGFEAAGGRCVFSCEWDKQAQRTYRANLGDECLAGDIRQVAPEEIASHDVLLAGFPCQPFSVAGGSKKNALGRPHGFACETQGTLFLEIARILRHHRPSAFVLENVKNLQNHDRGRTFEVIYRVLTEELGYHVTYPVIDAQGFVPQHRERIFIVGFRDPCGFDIRDVHFPPAEDGPRLRTVLHPEDGSEPAESPYTGGQLSRVSEKYVLTARLWDYLQAYKRKHEAKGNGFGFGLSKLSTCRPNALRATLISIT